MPELKEPAYWAKKGYTFLRHGECPACYSPVEFWRNPGGLEVPLTAKTYEPHFAGCSNAGSYRTELKLKEGAL